MSTFSGLLLARRSNGEELKYQLTRLLAYIHCITEQIEKQSRYNVVQIN